MSYQKESIKEFILSSIYMNNIVPDCLEIIYNNLVNNIINRYPSIDYIAELKPSIYELEILYNNNLQRYDDDIVLFINNEYINGIKFYISKNIINAVYLRYNIEELIIHCSAIGNVEILDILYKAYSNYLVGHEWISSCVYNIIKYKHANILKWFNDNNFIIYFDKLTNILNNNDTSEGIKLIINACDLGIEITFNFINDFINYIKNDTFKRCNILMIDTIYEYLIKNKYDDEITK